MKHTDLHLLQEVYRSINEINFADDNVDKVDPRSESPVYPDNYDDVYLLVRKDIEYTKETGSAHSGFLGMANSFLNAADPEVGWDAQILSIKDPNTDTGDSLFTGWETAHFQVLWDETFALPSLGDQGSLEHHKIERL